MRKLLVVLLVLIALAVVGDRVAEQLAEGQVADVVKEREDLPSKPDVEFHGFPFLTQVLSNDVSQVTMTLPKVEAAHDQSQVRVEDVRVTFFDVATSHNFRSATAQKMTGSALIPYDAVSALGPFEASYGGQDDDGVGLVSLELKQGDSLLPTGLTLTLGVAIENGSLVFSAPTGSQPQHLPAALRPIQDALVNAPHRLYGLPAAFTVKSLEATRAGLELTLAGRDVELTR